MRSQPVSSFRPRLAPLRPIALSSVQGVTGRVSHSGRPDEYDQLLRLYRPGPFPRRPRADQWHAAGYRTAAGLYPLDVGRRQREGVRAAPVRRLFRTATWASGLRRSRGLGAPMCAASIQMLLHRRESSAATQGCRSDRRRTTAGTQSSDAAVDAAAAFDGRPPMHEALAWHTLWGAQARTCRRLPRHHRQRP